MPLATQVVLAPALLLLLAAVAAPPPAAAAPTAPDEDEALSLQKREAGAGFGERLEDRLGGRRKRPFCNAFTGCGKKRSDESLNTLMELNSEPEVAELSRQILSEAKLREAIREAGAELQRQRHQQQLETNRLPEEGPLPLPLTGYRKRRSAPPPPAPASQALSSSHGAAPRTAAAAAAPGVGAPRR